MESAQTTIKTTVTCKGIGLHSGEKTRVFFHPAPSNRGIVFVKKSGKKLKYIYATSNYVKDTSFATTLGVDGDRIATVEHLVAAIRGVGIDNLIVEVQGEEIPAMDGSAYPFVELFLCAGIETNGAKKKEYVLKKKVVWGDMNRWIRAYPAECFKVDYIIDFSHPKIGQQMFFYRHDKDEFICKVSKARTFGFLEDISRLKEMGLAQGGSLDNAVVFDKKGVVNREGLRYPDEPVRHKLLDFIGDVSLLGTPIRGYFQVYCSGHSFNSSFVKFLQKNKEEYLSLEELRGIENSPKDASDFQVSNFSQ